MTQLHGVDLDAIQGLNMYNQNGGVAPSRICGQGVITKLLGSGKKGNKVSHGSPLQFNKDQSSMCMNPVATTGAKPKKIRFGRSNFYENMNMSSNDTASCSSDDIFSGESTSSTSSFNATIDEIQSPEFVAQFDPANTSPPMQPPVRNPKQPSSTSTSASKKIVQSWSASLPAVTEEDSMSEQGSQLHSLYSSSPKGSSIWRNGLDQGSSDQENELKAVMGHKERLLKQQGEPRLALGLHEADRLQSPSSIPRGLASPPSIAPSHNIGSMQMEDREEDAASSRAPSKRSSKGRRASKEKKLNNKEQFMKDAVDRRIRQAMDEVMLSTESEDASALSALYMESIPSDNLNACFDPFQHNSFASFGQQPLLEAGASLAAESEEYFSENIQPPTSSSPAQSPKNRGRDLRTRALAHDGFSPEESSSSPKNRRGRDFTTRARGRGDQDGFPPESSASPQSRDRSSREHQQDGSPPENTMHTTPQLSGPSLKDLRSRTLVGFDSFTPTSECNRDRMQNDFQENISPSDLSEVSTPNREPLNKETSKPGSVPGVSDTMQELLLQQQMTLKEMSMQNSHYRKELSECQEIFGKWRLERDKQRSTIQELVKEKTAYATEAGFLRNEMTTIRQELEALRKGTRTQAELQGGSQTVPQQQKQPVSSPPPKQQRLPSSPPLQQRQQKPSFIDEDFSAAFRHQQPQKESPGFNKDASPGKFHQFPQRSPSPFQEGSPVPVPVAPPPPPPPPRGRTSNQGESSLSPPRSNSRSRSSRQGRDLPSGLRSPERDSAKKQQRSVKFHDPPKSREWTLFPDDDHLLESSFEEASIFSGSSNKARVADMPNEADSQHEAAAGIEEEQMPVVSVQVPNVDDESLFHEEQPTPIAANGRVAGAVLAETERKTTNVYKNRLEAIQKNRQQRVGSKGGSTVASSSIGSAEKKRRSRAPIARDRGGHR